jgi:hypothetical protein
MLEHGWNHKMYAITKAYCVTHRLRFEDASSNLTHNPVLAASERCGPIVQEITLIYPQLHPPELNAQASNRVCNALALFQCVASHQETRELFLQAQIPLFLYPFLNTTSKTRPFEYLRLTALGVIGALVKQDDSTVCNGYLLPF